MPRYFMAALLLAWVPTLSLAQRNTGELRLRVMDPTGLPLRANGELVSQANQIRYKLATDADGRATATHLPLGIYYLRVESKGFSAHTELVEIRTEAPTEERLTLGVATLETTVVVRESDTLLDPGRTGTVHFVGKQQLAEARQSVPGRTALELVETQPGWLLEANGVLHPRGSEYSTQYVIDGIPITDNRSPGFAPAVETEELEAMRVFTAGYPAEYGRKLGGVVEVDTADDTRSGVHGKAVLGGGSYGTADGFASLQGRLGRTWASLGVTGALTDRYLDPPVEENYSNHASNTGVMTRIDSDLTPQDRIGAYLHSMRTRFLAPNETFQELAGQRQDRRNAETMGRFTYQRVVSPAMLASARVMVRDLGSELWSNPLSTPVQAWQQRGFRESYANLQLAWSRGPHELKAGGETVFTSIHEGFQYRITDPGFFAPDTTPELFFADRRQGREQAFFVQDQAKWGPLTISAGLRWDRYRLVTRESGISPRLALAYFLAPARLILRASYDRAFEVPAIENLLLASRPGGTPVPVSHGDFYQAGFAKSLLGRLRLDANWFTRRIRNFGDDSLLLNTGVSFPIAFSRARITGFEASLALPKWGRFSGTAAYSNLVGTGFLPVTGGLFLGADADLLASSGSFPITQDQRNTASAQLRYQVSSRVWVSAAARYGSGLPIEIESDIPFEGRYSQAILDRVNFDRGRVRPSISVDASAGVELWQVERMATRLEASVVNLADRLNVINFAGLLSGTALAPPRSFQVRLRTEW